jgi:hypothetical protein
MLLGRPLEATFSAATASSTAEKMMDCMTSVAAFCIAHS